MIGGQFRYVFLQRTAERLFHGKRHPAEMGESEIAGFPMPLAVEGHVACSTTLGRKGQGGWLERREDGAFGGGHAFNAESSSSSVARAFADLP